MVSQGVLEKMTDFKIGGKVIETIKYVDDLVKEEGILKDTLDRPVEIGRNYRMKSR